MKLQFKYLKIILLLLMLPFICYQCAPKLMVQHSGDTKMRKVIAESHFLEDQFSGLSLYDPLAKKFLYQLRDDRSFTPASNTKILTLFTALSYLPDSLTTLSYAYDNDRIFIKGAADPTFLHPDFEVYQKQLPFLNDTSKRIFFIDHDFKDVRYGAGWAWDDYPYGYQVEKTPMPLYANRVTAIMQNGELNVRPAFYKQFFERNESLSGPVYRDECTNSFSYNPIKFRNRDYNLPYVYNNYEHCKLLSEAWGREVKPYYKVVPANLSFNPIKQVPLDTALRRMMHQSDNFFAEQLLLASSMAQLGFMNTDSIIQLAENDIFAHVPDAMQWYDGSGLSRYNIFTPRSLVYILDKIHRELGDDQVRQIFAAGGISGTIKNWYADKNGPYVFAKTGTLKNHHCLSGFIYTNSGRMLIFSMMNSNYLGGSGTSKEKMQLILEYIKENY